MLNIYSVFHANLYFSVIPPAQYPEIIDSCYWPLLDITNELPVYFGLEFPITTILQIQKEDSYFIEKLKELSDKKKIEIVGSGYTQMIGPLIPSDLNYLNLKLANNYYSKLFGKIPELCYINEQAYSAGLIKICLDEGYKALMADWPNTIKYQNLPNEFEYSPQIAVDGHGNEIPILWNNCINFQKIQRYLQNSLSLNEILEYFQNKNSEEEDRATILYGSDWEIFNSKPGEIDLEYLDLSFKNEFGKFRQLLEAFIDNPAIQFDLPSNIIKKMQKTNKIFLNTPECPIPVKKQDSYNVLRWAASGRGDIIANTECYRIWQDTYHMTALTHSLTKMDSQHEIDTIRENLLELWSSDYRTHATEEKYRSFLTNIGSTKSKSKQLLNSIFANIKTERSDFILFNPLPYVWNNFPYEKRINFPPKRYFDGLKVEQDGKIIPTQLEKIKYYRDGSIRSCTLVIIPYIKPMSGVNCTFIIEATEKTKTLNLNQDTDLVTTSKVRLKLSKDKGGTKKELVFPELSDKWICGMIPHGTYNHISFSPDWFSGHTIILSREGKKITDLGRATQVFTSEGDCPIRLPVHYKTVFNGGELWKTFYVYNDISLLDVDYHFRFPVLFPKSFRWGILTFNPSAFEQSNLKYLTKNGGEIIESYSLYGHHVKQDISILPQITAETCLGATEGWVAISDDKKTITVATPKTQLYSVPLLHFEEVKDSYFLRIYQTIAEDDETNLAVWKGHLKISTQIFGEKGSLNKGSIMASARNIGLVFIPNEEKCHIID